MIAASAFLLAAALACGSERADQKHMSDALAGAVNLVPSAATIEQLGDVEVPEPVRGDEARGVTEEEYQVYVLEGTITVAKLEADHDVHLALSDGEGHTMIAEAVDPRCARKSIVLDEIIAARVAVLKAAGGVAISPVTLRRLVGKRVRVTGVAFLDRIHGQTGVAPNGIEVHPMLALEFLKPGAQSGAVEGPSTLDAAGSTPEPGGIAGETVDPGPFPRHPWILDRALEVLSGRPAAVTPPGCYGGNHNSQHRDGRAADGSVSRGRRALLGAWVMTTTAGRYLGAGARGAARATPGPATISPKPLSEHP